MTIQFRVPPEFVIALKGIIKGVNPAVSEPTDADVVTYISTAIWANISGLVPNVTLASQVSLMAQVADLSAQLRAQTIAELQVQLVEDE